jgi:DNA-binding PadR family transcriptional regulator
LGRYHERYALILLDKPLQASLSKGAFIELLTNAGLAGKKERALYKNLEDLEKAKLVSYDNRTLVFTEKGRKEYERLVQGLDPYFRVVDMLEKTNVLKLTKKATMQLRW